MNELNQVEIAQRLFSAIDIIVDKKLEKIKFDVTIVAEVIEVPGGENQSFRLRQQDLEFDAYPLYQSEYSKGSMVYVLVPSSDFRKKKYIIGAVAPSAPVKSRAIKQNSESASILSILEDLAYGRTQSAQDKIRRLKEEEKNE